MHIIYIIYILHILLWNNIIAVMKLPIVLCALIRSNYYCSDLSISWLVKTHFKTRK